MEPESASLQPTKGLFSRQDILPILVIAATAIIVVLPIFLRGFPSGADIRHHYKWAFYFWDGLREGAIYPRWLAGANRGYGSPVMFYYPPLALYAVAVFNAAVGNLLLAIKLSCTAAMFASGISMYIFARNLLARTYSLAAAAVYMIAPYHVFELYRVNALSEFWALVWIPLVLDATRRVAQTNAWRATAYLSVCYALLLLTHIPASLITTAIIPVFVLVITRNKNAQLKIGSGLVIGVGLSAFFLVSIVFETKYVHIQSILANNYLKAFLFEDFSAFSWESLLMPADYPNVAGYVREANLVAIGFVLLLIVVSLVLGLEWRSIRENRSQAAAFKAILLVAVISLLMTTRITVPLWNAIPQLQYLQSPIRWLVLATVAIAILTGLAFKAAVRARWRRVMMPALVVAIVANLAISLHISTQRPVDPAGLENKLQRHDVPEYTPLWWDQTFHEQFRESAVVVGDGAAEVRAIDDSGLSQIYEVSAETDATLRFRSVWFPGWAARIDANRVELGRSAEGNIQVVVPAGDHQVTLKFEETWRHIRANVVSGVAALILGTILYRTRRSKRKSREEIIDEKPVRLADPDGPA